MDRRPLRRVCSGQRGRGADGLGEGAGTIQCWALGEGGVERPWIPVDLDLPSTSCVTVDGCCNLSELWAPLFKKWMKTTTLSRLP